MDRSTLENIKPLLLKHLQQELTPDEAKQLEAWASGMPENRQLLERISDPQQLETDINLYIRSKENIFSRLQEEIPELSDNITSIGESSVHRLHFLRRGWMKYAAAVVLIAGIAGWLWFSRSTQNKPTDEAVIVSSPDVQPGGNKAILTLADGSTILLDSANTGAIATQGNTVIEKTNTGQILYKNGDVASGKMMTNSMRTPMGGQYQLTLPDGTRVWLNAASSITYPVAFTGPERKVQVSGEVYFDVTHNAKQPFIVDVEKRSSIKVLGTRFNLNAYDNEQTISTTVLEGSVQVNNDVVLKAGQQSNQSNSNQSISVNNQANMERTIAWKNGRFDFNGLDLPAVMRQIERWYDISVEYAAPVPKETFRGRLTRDLSLNQVLNILNTMEIRYKLENRKLILY